MVTNHEEADTNVILHAVFADRVFAGAGIKGRIIIRSTNTDVIVLAIHYCAQLRLAHRNCGLKQEQSQQT